MALMLSRCLPAAGSAVCARPRNLVVPRATAGDEAKVDAKLGKAQLVKAVADKIDFTQKDVALVFDALLDVVTEALAKGERVGVVGFGTLEPRARKARTGVNPRTGQPLAIKASTAVGFKVGSKLKDAVNGVVAPPPVAKAKAAPKPATPAAPKPAAKAPAPTAPKAAAPPPAPPATAGRAPTRTSTASKKPSK